MGTLLEKIKGKPSVAVRASILGIKKHSQREDFYIDMDTYGFSYDGSCFGCMATCGLQELTGVTFGPDTIWNRDLRAAAVGESLREVTDFEDAINELRMGAPSYLFRFCGVQVEGYDDIEDFAAELAADVGLTCMDTDDWQDYLPSYVILADRLEALGL